VQAAEIELRKNPAAAIAALDDCGADGLPAPAAGEDAAISAARVFGLRDAWLQRCQLLPLFQLPTSTAPVAAVAPGDAALTHLSFLRGHWLLLIGDSTDRYFAEFLCESASFPFLDDPPAAAVAAAATGGGAAAALGTNRVYSRLNSEIKQCYLPQLDLYVVNFFVHGALELAEWTTKAADEVADFEFLYSHFPRPPLMITLQAGLWDAAGWADRKANMGERFRIASTPPTQPDFPVLSFLQAFEHAMLRPVATVFHLRSVLAHTALVPSRASALFADDPTWVTHAKVPLGVCYWPPRIGADMKQCPLMEMQRTVEQLPPPPPAPHSPPAAPLPKNVEHVQRRIRTLSANVQNVLAKTPLWRQGVRSSSIAAGAAASCVLSEPLLALRSIPIQKLEFSVRNPSVQSINVALALTARAYRLPFVDHGELPMHYTADGSHLRAEAAQLFFNAMLNIIKQQCTAGEQAH